MKIPNAARLTLLSLLVLTVALHPHAPGIRPLRAEVSPLHPRIFVRNDLASVGRGLKVSQLRERATDPLYQRWRRPTGAQNLGTIVERAARYLESGSSEDLDAVRSFLRTHTYSQREHDVGGLLAGAEMALALDWAYQGIGQADRAAILSNIITTADSSYEFLIHGEPDINHNYTYMALRTIAVCGLVMKGEGGGFDRRADDYLSLAQEWLEGRGKVLDTWKSREGAWAEGSHYTFHETIRTLIMTLHAYRSATGTDYLGLIERSYGNFVAGSGRFLIACTRPDLTLERIGDVSPSRALAAITVPLTVEMLAAALGDAGEQSRLRSFSRELQEAYGDKALHPSFDWGMRMFWDAHAAAGPSYRTLPLAMRLGNGTDEHIAFRNGWTEGSTLITILAGDHYTDHQHFDKGHFLIYHRGGLIVDSGAYDGMSAPNSHWGNYSTRTLAHNCLLIFDPDESLPAGYVNDGGQLVLRGLQHHADWMSYVEHSRRERLQTARVEAYQADEKSQFDYVRVDLSASYGNKVRNYDRQFVYFPDTDLLVLFDRIRSARPDFGKTWLAHFQDPPRIDGADPPQTGIHLAASPTALVSAARNGQLELGAKTIAYDGKIFIHTLLPQRRFIRVIGGSGYEYYNEFTHTNYPPANAANTKSPRETGSWRMEVSPADHNTEDLFLSAFHIADASVRETTETRLLEVEGDKMAGLQFFSIPINRVVLFSRDIGNQPVSLPVKYQVTSAAEARHLLVGLPPRQEVTVRINHGARFHGTISSQGVLSFDDRKNGLREVEVNSVAQQKLPR